MVCVAVHGEPVIGVICDPFTGKISWAWVGAGMSSDLKKIDQANTSKKIVVTVSRSHAGKVKEVLKKKFENDLEIKIAAGAGKMFNNNEEIKDIDTFLPKYCDNFI